MHEALGLIAKIRRSKEIWLTMRITFEKLRLKAIKAWVSTRRRSEAILRNIVQFILQIASGCQIVDRVAREVDFRWVKHIDRIDTCSLVREQLLLHFPPANDLRLSLARRSSICLLQLCAADDISCTLIAPIHSWYLELRLRPDLLLQPSPDQLTTESGYVQAFVASLPTIMDAYVKKYV